MKGQSAIEYLTTYGWALLFIIIVVGVIISMGITNANRYQTAECTIQPELPCISYMVKDGDHYNVYMNLSNGLGFNITLSHPVGTARDSLGGTGIVDISEGGPNLKPGDSALLKINMDSSAIPGNYVVVYFTLNYTDELGIPHQTSGRIRGHVRG